MIGYGKQSIDKKDINEVIKVLKSDYLTQGPKILELENLLINKFGSKYCTVVSNGTAALHLAGSALGWEKNDYVITSPLTFLSSSNCILYCGSTPFFVDIDSKTNCLDINKLEETIIKLKKNNKNIKSVIGVDFAGLPCDWKSIKFLSNKYNLTTINDNCHAIGAKIDKSTQYAIKFADIVTHSYHPVKNITTGEGGALLSKKKSIDNKIKLLRNHGTIRNSRQQNLKGMWFYDMVDLGFNYRLTDIQASIGITQIKKLNKFIKVRNNIARFYDKIFNKYEHFTIPEKVFNYSHAYHLYILRFDFKKYKKNKKSFFKYLYLNGVNIQVHYKPIHMHSYYQSKFGYKKNDFPIAEKYYEESFSIPIYPDLREDQMRYVAKLIIEYLVD